MTLIKLLGCYMNQVMANRKENVLGAPLLVSLSDKNS